MPTASPQATTLMSSSPPPPAQEPSPASTAKGFAPPQQYPVTQTPQPAHQKPTQMAMQPPSIQQMPTQMAMQPPPIQQMPAPPQPAFQMPPMPAPPPPEPVYRPPPVILDVTPRSLGIATVAGYCEELIRRNSRLPTEMVKLFTTSHDKQSAVRIVVCQGESRRLDNNTVIGDLRLEGIPARPRGETSIEVTFQLDVSGILQVSARDAQTGREQTARLDLVGGVRGEDVAGARERMQQLRR
jgi:molecular chaperone DnaK